ncbi:MAG TPA: helix-turn-helix domain-containing protein [Mycobacteriales bacterium]|nr:helix-turn-helix domain-containing protein [Mycobacteriales bacterium]
MGAAWLHGVRLTVRTQAITPVRWLRLHPPSASHLMRTSAEFASAVAASMAMDHAAALDQLQQSAFLTVRQRLIKQLLVRASIEGRSLHITQRDMANLVGSVREVVGRIAHDLESRGAIKSVSAGVVEVVPAVLERLCDEKSDVRDRQRCPGRSVV